MQKLSLMIKVLEDYRILKAQRVTFTGVCGHEMEQKIQMHVCSYTTQYKHLEFPV